MRNNLPVTTHELSLSDKFLIGDTTDLRDKITYETPIS
jgi:hypothetical protein